MVRKRTLAINLAIGLLVGMQATLAEAQQQVPSDNRYIIGSNAPGSVPYNIGIGLSSLAQIVLLPEKNLALAPVATDGYDSSLQQVLNGAGHFAIIDSVAAHQALAAADDRFEVVATLWHEVDYFILASEYVRTGTISDLATLSGKDLATDLSNENAAGRLLANFGVLIDQHAGPAAIDWETRRDDFDRGEIAGLAMTGPVPSASIMEALSRRGGKVQMLEFSQWQMAQVADGWHIHQLTPQDYPGLSGNVNTVARTLMLVAHSDVPEEAVYQVVKMMFENLPYLANLDRAASRISLDHALGHESDISLHPGAVRYYEEVGVLAEGMTAEQLDAAAGHGAHAGHGGDASHDAHVGHGGDAGQGSEHEQHAAHNSGKRPEHVHDEAMISRARAEVHDGDVILKIGRPAVLSHPETEIFQVFFGLGKTDLVTEDVPTIREVMSHIMTTYENYGREPEVYVEGHTDSTGSWEANYEVAHQRALSVSKMLIDEGVPESWIHISDYSEEGLAVPTADDVPEERNRRVEITIIPQE